MFHRDYYHYFAIVTLKIDLLVREVTLYIQRKNFFFIIISIGSIEFHEIKITSKCLKFCCTVFVSKFIQKLSTLEIFLLKIIRYLKFRGMHILRIKD